MSNEQDEQLYGLPQIEQAQGYEPMVPASPVDADAGTPQDVADADSAAHRHFSRPPEADFGELTERPYVDPHGERVPANQVVSKEQAAHDLASVRAAEADAFERERNEALARVLDEFKIQAGEPVTTPENDAAYERLMAGQQEQLQPQPEHTEVPGVDPKIAQAFQNPKIRAVLEQVNQGVEQTKQAYQQAVQHNALVGLAVLNSAFPEMNGLNTLAEINAALRVMPPERAQAYRQHLGQVTALAEAYRRQEGELQQQRQALQAQQYQQAQATFERFAAEHDAQVLTNDPPETVAAIRNALVDEARAAGISENELKQVYNTNSAMRHSFVQNLLADGMRFRLAQRSVSRAASRSIPHVVRPGSPAEMQTRTEAALAEAQAKLKPSMSAKEAAAYVIARRAAR